MTEAEALQEVIASLDAISGNLMWIWVALIVLAFQGFRD